MLNFTCNQFEYHLQRKLASGIEQRIEKISLYSIEIGYIRSLEVCGWEVTARYFSPNPYRIN